MPLVLAATPIGDPRDASERLRIELSEADLIAAEDTRRLRRLAADLGVTLRGRVVSYYEAVESQRQPELLAALAAGDRVLLVTDAGMPAVSDPGFRLVQAAAAADLPVTVAPGPSAALAALALSGLPSDRFCFEGFLPRRAGERRSRLAELASERRTMLFFEAPHRLAASLTDMAELLGGDRPAAVCRELTKRYEEVRRGSLGDLAAWAADGVRGEITVVVSGAAAVRQVGGPQDWAAQVADLMAAGLSRRDAAAAVAAEAGVSRRDVYAASLDTNR